MLLEHVDEVLSPAGEEDFQKEFVAAVDNIDHQGFRFRIAQARLPLLGARWSRAAVPGPGQANFRK